MTFLHITLHRYATFTTKTTQKSAYLTFITNNYPQFNVYYEHLTPALFTLWLACETGN